MMLIIKKLCYLSMEHLIMSEVLELIPSRELARRILFLGLTVARRFGIQHATRWPQAV